MYEVAPHILNSGALLPTPIFFFRSTADWDTIHGFVRLHFLYIERVCFPVAKLFIAEGWSPPAICIR